MAYNLSTLVVDRFHFGESVGELAAQQQQPGFRPTCMRHKLWHLVSHQHPQPDHHLFTGTQVSHHRLHTYPSSPICLCVTSHSGIFCNYKRRMDSLFNKTLVFLLLLTSC